MHKNDQRPMSLENLPNYVKSLKENGSTGGSCVVDMGVIEQPKSNKWLKRIVAASLLMTTIFGIAVYNSTPEQFTVIVDVEQDNPIQAISKMVEDNQGEVVAVKQKEGSTYEVKVSTRRSKKAFMEQMKNEHTKNATR